MSSSISISVLSQNTLNDFCSTNKVSSKSVVKLAIAIVLHQYFDLPEFTCAEALSEDDNDHTRYPPTRSSQMQYAPELASTISIRGAFGLKETEPPSDNDLAPLLVNHTTTAPLISGLTASLLFARKASFSSLAAQQVSSLGHQAIYISLIMSSRTA